MAENRIIEYGDDNMEGLAIAVIVIVVIAVIAFLGFKLYSNIKEIS